MEHRPMFQGQLLLSSGSEIPENLQDLGTKGGQTLVREK